ncbi:MAG: glucuronate isomerase [Clostridium sp.]|uniref:glucuronate isomerase n=1 Tax=Clostridium sp. TaxID=1506 RepID=UPI00290EB336|nr:glucuronate isomerase [Clostridium sp.]MDU5110696.1 glucuronate isomerase [Clostridium sp.]
MKKFMNENFLLSNETAVRLFHDYSKNMPIIDYHCHLSPKEIYENKRFKNITEVWLYGDHYKWRAMRSNGIDENTITGNASDYDKFLAWAKTLQISIGNPLYHWTHLELQRFFKIYEPLTEKTAPEIWNATNKILNSGEFSTRDLIKKSNVEAICTTDDPIDSLEYHIKIKELKDFNTKVLPTFRPDKGIEISRDAFLPWVKKLGEVVGKEISDYELFLQALESRVEFFNTVGCKISDHALDMVVYSNSTKEEAAEVFNKVLKGECITLEEEKKYKTYTLIFLAKLYHKFDWAMQLHIGALRNNNTIMFNKLGSDTGFDSINDGTVSEALSKLLDSLNKDNNLPKTILYTLNPKDNYVLGTMIGNFQGDRIPGKIQFGSAWWFNDSIDGMTQQIKTLANLGLLSRFVGMLTDSRSFLSYPRHEYFRRILCNIIGQWVEDGEIPNDMELLGSIVQDISFKNAKEYFKL